MFDENGYIIIKKAFPLEKILIFQKALKKLVDCKYNEFGNSWNNFSVSSNLSCDEKLITLKNHNPNYISIIQRIISRSPEFYSLASCVEIVPFMRSLHKLDDSSPIYIINNGIVFTCPCDNKNSAVSNFETEWHNDIFYTIPHSRFWQIWVPLLHHATDEVGTLMVCPGSHKNGIGKQRIDINAGYNQRYTIDPSTILKYSPISIKIELGDVFIFNSQLIHKSGINTSSHVRCTMLGAYHDASRENFSPLGFEYKYYDKTPEQYFYELFGDENAKKIINEKAAPNNLSIKNGV